MLIEILPKKCDKKKCDPFIVEVWLVEILLKKVRHELVWPILLGRFDRGSHFLMSHFLGWWTARRHGGVGVGVWLVGDGVVGVRRWKGWLGFGQGDLDVLWIIGLVGKKKKNKHESFVNRLTYGSKRVKSLHVVVIEMKLGFRHAAPQATEVRNYDVDLILPQFRKL